MRSGPVPAKTIYISTSITLFLQLSTYSHASNLSIGHQVSDYVFSQRQNEFEASLSGINLYASIDLTDKLSFSVDYSDLSSAQGFDAELKTETTAEALSFSGHYVWQDWFASVQYANLDGRLESNEATASMRVETEANDTDIISVSSGRDWQLNDWLLSSHIGLHYNDWQQLSLRRSSANDPVNEFSQDGQSWFTSLGIDLSNYKAVTDSIDLMWSTGITWNQLLTDNFEESAEPANNRPTPRAGSNNTSLATGTESYAQVDAYVSVFFGDSWQVDVAAGTDLENNYDGAYWSISLGYSY